MGMIHSFHVTLQKLPVFFRLAEQELLVCPAFLFQFLSCLFCIFRLNGILPAAGFAAQLLKHI
jgi:hypothetical protein